MDVCDFDVHPRCYGGKEAYVEEDNICPYSHKMSKRAAGFKKKVKAIQGVDS